MVLCLRLLSAKDAFKFGASRIFESSYAVVISFGIGSHTVLLRVGVVNGDVPLLVSRPALAQLGMVMDLAENTASFRKLGVQNLALLSTDTGHPALPVCPQTVSNAAIKSCDWRSRELLTVPKSQQYTAFMTTHNPEGPDDDGVSRVGAPPLLPGLSLVNSEPTEVAQGPKVFYPKKISIEAYNILTSDKLNPASFLAWWSQTPITNDFWIEDELLLHRIHVTPRRMFFDPRGWNTSKLEQKSALLDALGSMRSSQGFACSTQRAFPEVHDQWKEPGSKSSFPLLWIGRTSFSRAARQCVTPIQPDLHGLSSEPPDSSGGYQEEGAMGTPAPRASGGSQSPRTHDPRQLDGARDPFDHPRGHEEGHYDVFESGELRRDLPLDQDDRGGVGGGPGGIGNGSAGQGEQGVAHEAPQGPRWPWPADSPELRTLPRVHVPRNPDVVSPMGGKGGVRERRRSRGPEDVCDLGDEGPRGDGRLRDQLDPGPLQGLRGERPGALPPGVFRRELVGCPDDQPFRRTEEQSKGEGIKDRSLGDAPADPGTTSTSPLFGVFLGQPDGARIGPGGAGRDSTPPIETRGAPGSSRAPSLGIPSVNANHGHNIVGIAEGPYLITGDDLDVGSANFYEAGRNRQHGASFVQLPDEDRASSHFGGSLRGHCSSNSFSVQTTAGGCHRNPGGLPVQTIADEHTRNPGELPGQVTAGGCHRNPGELPDQTSAGVHSRNPGELPDQTTAGECHRNPGELPDQTTAGECHRNPGELPDSTAGGEHLRDLGELPGQTTAGGCHRNPGELPDQATAGECHRNPGELPDSTAAREHLRDSGELPGQTTAGVHPRNPGELPDQTTVGDRECHRNPGELPDQTVPGEHPRDSGELPDQTTAGECHRDLRLLPPCVGECSLKSVEGFSDATTGVRLSDFTHESVSLTPFDQVIDEVYLQDDVEGGHLPSDHSGKSLEEAASDLLKNRKFSLDDLRDLLPLLPIRDCRKRRGISGGPTAKVQSFLGGLWNHGGLHGISKDSCRYPKFVSYVNEVMKRQDSSKGLGWSSFIITKNVATSIHRDSHNLAGSPIYTVSVGEFSGGHVWVERDNSDDPLHMPVVWRPDRDGDPVPGYTVSTHGVPHTLDPRRRHATEAWEGERWCISCYTGRAYPETDVRLRDGLRELRFPLRSFSYALAKDDEVYTRVPRPIKSTRRGLWRNAKRIIALTTWCTFAASSCLLPEFPPGRGPEGVTLFEIGGTNRTFDAHDLGYLTAEPLGVDDFMQEPGLSMATAILDELRPQRVWVHMCNLCQGLEKVYVIIQRQLAAGRTTVLDGVPGKDYWTSEALLAFLDIYHHRWEPAANGNVELHLNPTETANYEDHGDCEERLRRYLLQREGARGPEQEVHVVDTRAQRGTGVIFTPEPEGAQAITFAKGAPIKKEVQSSLKRLHQNLGHPLNEDIARHLRIAGAGGEVVDAAKRIQCQVCARNRRAPPARPATLPSLLDFNQVVAVDAFSAYDINKRRHEFMMVTDLATGFSLAGSLTGHSTQSMEDDFCTIWSNSFGAPGTIALDLESGLQAGFGRFSEWHGTKLRPAAGQAHFQQGTVERTIQTWKAIWKKLVDDHSVSKNDLKITVTAINTALNTLKKSSGFSPAQAVWGRDPQLPEDLFDSSHGHQIEHVLTHDRKRAREMTLRLAAKEAFFRNQNDNKLRRALLQRSRVAGPEVQVGDFVYFYRKPKNSKDWRWIGPATVIGFEGPNFWTSFAGRCHLVAREHLRMATGEEIGSAFTLRTTKEDLEKLLDRDFAEEEIYVGDEEQLGGDPPRLPDEGHDNDITVAENIDDAYEGDMEVEEDQDIPVDVHEVPRRRKRKKGPPGLPHGRLVPVSETPIASDDGGDEGQGKVPRPLQEAFMLKLPKTPRGREKALEKELPWAFIPSSQHAAFRAAELKQWEEHRDHNALVPLSVEDSRKILATKGDRVLGSRFAYRDKHWSKRKQNEELPWKPKARLVIAGHRDPDLAKGLATHAPTISRQGIFLLLQLLASNLINGWTGHAGDVSSAFLCGQELMRELYLKQPKVGLGDLHPEQLLHIRRPVFGLVDSPSSWWDTLRSKLGEVEIKGPEGRLWHIRQCTLDHCIFMVQEAVYNGEGGVATYKEPQAYLGVHVDDILLIGLDEVCTSTKASLSEVFPIPEWETGSFEYVGSFIEVRAEEIKISQTGYVKTRLFEIEIDKDQKDWETATEIQRHDNMSLVGALSWLSSQTRPDLQVGVSLSQQCQKSPCVGDIRFTNALAKRAYEHHEEGVLIRPVDLSRAVLLCYHDAGWANCPQSDDDPYYTLTPDENAEGVMKEGPYEFHLRKAKRANSCIASQLGGLYLLCDSAVLQGGRHRPSILDWKSSACDRVCRSTFAAETMGCATAIETGEYILRFLQTLVDGKLARSSCPLRYEIRFLSDCKSLYDTLTKDGIPRPPSCKRLAIDLAAIRDDLKSLGRLAWVPTTAQLADHLTKPLKAGDWWNILKGGLMLTFKERKDVLNQCQSVK